MSTEGPIRRYLDARVWAVKENLGDFLDAAFAGYWDEVLHALGAESPSVLSQRFEIRRAFARQSARGQPVLRPTLPRIQPGGSLKVS